MTWQRLFVLQGVFLFLCASSQQAQNANIYAYFKWSNPNPAWNIDQDVNIVTASSYSFFSMMFTFSGQNFGGYIGLQQTSSGPEAIFSIWQATRATPANSNASCQPFGGEGSGYSCRMNKFPLQYGSVPNPRFYTYRVWRISSDSGGVWWLGVIIDTATGIEYELGQIYAPSGCMTMDPKSVMNFIEFWGPAAPTCNDIPLSIGFFTQPSENQNQSTVGVWSGSSRGSCCGGSVVASWNNAWPGAVATLGGQMDKDWNFTRMMK